MANSNIVTDESSQEANRSETRISKGRMTQQRNSILFSIREDYSPLQQHGRSTSHSLIRSGYNRRPGRYENTYRMEPPNGHKLDLIRIRHIATSVIETAIAGYIYDGNQAREFTGVLAERIRSQMQQLPFPRYKIVTQVSIGQNKSQHLLIASRCLWDPKLDHHVTITKEILNAYITATIFFVYTE
jgi:hypothetical protein